MTDIYTLKALAKKEGISYDSMRRIAAQIAKGEMDSWRDYQFFGPGKKYWLAFPKGQCVTFHDSE